MVCVCHSNACMQLKTYFRFRKVCQRKIHMINSSNQLWKKKNVNGYLINFGGAVSENSIWYKIISIKCTRERNFAPGYFMAIWFRCIFADIFLFFLLLLLLMLLDIFHVNGENYVWWNVIYLITRIIIRNSIVVLFSTWFLIENWYMKGLVWRQSCFYGCNCIYKNTYSIY